jgi:hypothetical protein
MYFIYLDESGNSGLNLADREQPVFLLCAMLVAEEHWQPLERTLVEARENVFPPWLEEVEVHASDLRNGRGAFKNLPVSARIAFRDAWMDAGAAHGVKLIHRHIEKRRYHQWLTKTFGGGVTINPHVVAFALIARIVDDYLTSLPGNTQGILISDENKEIVADVEKSIRILRGEVGTLKLGRIIEKGFFIQSSKSLPLQLCDLFALSLRKRAERLLGAAPKSIDDTGIQRAEALLHKGNERFQDVIAWLTKQHEQNRGKSP